MTDIEKFMKESIKNPQPLFDTCFYQPEIYYLFDRESNEILLAFLDNGILSHESLVFIAKTFNGKVNYNILKKSTYEELVLGESNDF
jgi:hypothetical protein